MANALRLDRTPESLRRTGFRLCGAAWILFLVSMFLPANGSDALDFSLRGWQCAWITFAWPYYKDTLSDWTLLQGVYFFSFAASNLLTLTAPLWLQVSKRGAAGSHLFFALLLLAFADAVSVALPFNGPLDQWQIGYYVWMASFGLMAAGSLLVAQSRRVKSASAPATSLPRSRTPEESAAERELRDYLRSV